MSGKGKVITYGIIALAALVLAVGAYFGNEQNEPGPSPQLQPAPASLFPVQERAPAAPAALDPGMPGPLGQPTRLTCAHCHSLRHRQELVKAPEALKRFHLGLKVEHGGLACAACHHAGNYDLLRLSDQTGVQFEDVKELCAQCHGGKAADYEAGVHGGMTGYWNLSEGPRRRLTCVDCHDPHHPALEPVWPARSSRTGRE